jgi:hypothetical protein
LSACWYHASAMGGSVTDTNQVQKAVGCFLPRCLLRG